jgi:hypothetical protein
MLAAVRVNANRPERAQAQVANPYQREVGAAEQYDQGVEGRVSPNAAGNLSMIASTIPGITMTPSGPSMLGASAASNLTTLNGMALPAGAAARGARRRAGERCHLRCHTRRLRRRQHRRAARRR